VRQCRSLFTLVALAGLAAPALGQDTVNLAWKFEKGKTYYQELTTKTTQKITVMGMNITQNQDQTFYFSWTPEKFEEKDKTWTIKQKIIGLKMNIQIGGNPVTFDSTKDSTTANPLTDFFKALVDSEFTLTVQTAPELKVTNVAGHKEFLDKLIKTNQQLKPLLEQILSEDALKQMTDPYFAVVPNKPVKKGDSWERKTTLNMGPIGQYESTYKFTLEGPDEKNKNLQRIKVETTLKYLPPANAAGAGGALPFRITKANLTSKDANGTILFDTDKGRVQSSKMSMKLVGTLDIEIGGMTTTVDLDQEQTTETKTTDENPIPAKKPA
jgi:hypothetical protein